MRSSAGTYRFRVGFLLLVIFGALSRAGAVEPAPADLALTNARVKTPSGWAQAVAIRDGLIVAVGSDAEALRLLGPETRVLDLDGRAVFPGLHDMHVHPQSAGLEMFSCKLEPGAGPDSIAETLRECAADKAPGEWITGGNWVAAAFGEGEQHRALLDTVAPDNPVLLADESHHSVWVNSLALKIAGITRDTPSPAGGIIERDAAGEPNGLLRENATRLVRNRVPPPSDELKRKALALAADTMLSQGITSFMVASLRPRNIDTFSWLAGEGLLKQRVRGCLVWEGGTEQDYTVSEALIAARHSYNKGRFRADCIKIFVDGVPIESRTAAMLEPYAGSDSEKGFFMIPPARLKAAVAEFDRQGLPIKFHVTGDAAARLALDAVAAARAANGWGGARHHVGHNTFVHPADVPRVRELQMAWEFSPYIWYPTPIASVDVLSVAGPERMARFTPIRDAVESNALVTVGSDWPIVPSVNPWLAMETMVTRRLPGGGEEILAEGQRVSLDAAFRILTENGALLMGHRHKVGSIEVGMLADLVVTETNPFEAPVTGISSTRVRMTFIEGEKVHDAVSPGQE